VLEIAETRVGLRPLEGRLDELLMLCLACSVLGQLAIADRLLRGRGEVAVSLLRAGPERGACVELPTD
jgi:hypothetical protein